MRRSKSRNLSALRPEGNKTESVDRKPKNYQPNPNEPLLTNTQRRRCKAIENEKKLCSVFAASPEAIIVTDQNGNIVECNQAALKIYNTASKRELIGKNALDFVVEKDRERSEEYLKKTLEQGFLKNIELTLVTKNGGKYLADLSASAVKDALGHPTAFVVIWRDITDRKQTERALVESEERYRSVVDNIGIGVSVISPHMEILTLNMKMKEWFPNIDTSKKPLCYKAFNDPPRKGICTHCPTSKTLRDGQVHASVTNTPKGKEVINYRVVASPVKDKNGRVIAAIEMVEDISQRLRLEKQLARYAKHLKELVEERAQRLRASEKSFRSVVDYASEAIVTIDSNLRIVFWNKAAEKLFGYSSREILGKPVAKVVPRESRERHYARMKRWLSSGKLRTEKAIEAYGLKKDGTDFPQEISYSSWATTKGSFLTAIIRDTTERKRYEKRLRAVSLYEGKLNSAMNLHQIYGLTLDAMEQALGFEHAEFLVVDKNALRVASARGNCDPFVVLPLDGSKGGITVRAANTREPVLSSDLKKERDYYEDVPHMNSELAVPIIVGDCLLGVLNVESIRPNAFDEKDLVLLQILASHAATAIGNLKKMEEIEKRSRHLTLLMKSSAEMIHSADLKTRLQAILDAINGLGWRRAVLSVRDENLDILSPDDIVTAGLTDEERKYLWTHKKSGREWRERFGQDFERFKIGEFYYLPWSDPWVRKSFSAGTVSSHLKPDEMVDWDPEDLLYAPLKLADGRILGVVSMDDPVDGRRPTKESLAPLEMFLYQAAVAIENARLLQRLKEYSVHLEEKIEERTQQLRNMQMQLLKSERLAAIGELAGMIGHDLRNPLTGIAGATYYLKTRLSSNLDEKSREMLEVIGKDVECSNKIINDLLEYSREIKLDFKETNPYSILRDTLSSLKTPANIQLLNEARKGLKIKVDVDKMQRVFMNIIKNAFDAMPRGGALTIKSEKTGGDVSFSFNDTGVGMSKATIEKLWTPLFTTKAKGMGFGLPICKRIVEAHGGKISIKSTLRKGTTTTVTIPTTPKSHGGESIWVNMPESLLSTTMKA